MWELENKVEIPQSYKMWVEVEQGLDTEGLASDFGFIVHWQWDFMQV